MPSPSEKPLSRSADFIGALEELNRQFDIPLEELLSTLEKALASAYQQAFAPLGTVEVTVNPATADLEVRSRQTGEDGTEVIEDLPVEEFRRLAAQTARSLVLRRMRELERDRILSDFAARQGELASGTVDRLEGGAVILDLGNAEGVLGVDDQIPGEVLHTGKPVTVVIMEHVRRGLGARIRVSRTTRLLVQRLLEAEVPEIRSGAVEVREIAREPGLRSKVAVAARDSGLDPVGACIGPRGVRHRALLSELSGEHVDFIEWSDEPDRLVAGALGPATVLSVEIDKATRTARVRVPAAQLSLAIGRDGQNARLAAKLSGWRIDIKPEGE